MGRKRTLSPIKKYFKRILTSKYFFRIIGLVLLVFILRRVNLGEVVKALAEASVVYVITGVLLTLPTIFIRSLRWNLILRSLGILIPVRKSFLLQTIGQMSFLTPGKVGELIKAFYLKGENYSLKKSVVSLIGDRLFDLISVSLVALFAFFYFFGFFPRTTLLLVVSGGGGLGILIYYRAEITDFVEAVVRFFLPEHLELQVGELFAMLKNALREITFSNVFNYFLLSILGFLLQALRIWVFGLGLGMEVAYLPLAGIVGLMSLANLLPISFLGLGTRDAVFVYFFGLLGVSRELTIALSLIVLGNIVIAAGFGGICFVVKPPRVNFENLSTS